MKKKNAWKRNSKWPTQKNWVFQKRQFSIFFVKISVDYNIWASLQHLGVESDNSVMDESNNLGFLQVYSLTQLIQGLWQDLYVSNKKKGWQRLGSNHEFQRKM